MKHKTILAIQILLITAFGLVAFQIPKNIQKKIDKEIKMAFNIAVFSLEPITVSDEINKTLPIPITQTNFYKIQVGQQCMGYAFVDKAASKTDQFDYLILLDKHRIIKKVKIVMYREDYGGEIGSKRWLKQFIGKSKDDSFHYGKDIIAISGATISATSMTLAVSKVLKTVTLLHKKNSLQCN